MDELKELIMIQNHNHEIAKLCAKYEDEALKAIADGDIKKFDRIMELLNKLQRLYKERYKAKELMESFSTVIEVPKGATNGDVIQALFPSAHVVRAIRPVQCIEDLSLMDKLKGKDSVSIKTEKVIKVLINGFVLTFTVEWWNKIFVSPEEYNSLKNKPQESPVAGKE